MPKKPKAVRDMEDAVQKMFAEIAPGAKLQFDPDEALAGYRKGRALTHGEAKKAAADKRPVWVYCKAHDETGPRSNHAFNIEVTDDGQSFMLDDGSSFAHDMDIHADDAVAADSKGGWGILQVFEAVKK